MDLKINSFSEALLSFDRLINHDPATIQTLDEVLLDGLENGKAQKFEYTLNLCWKAIKEFLKKREGVDEASPKKVVKAFFFVGHINEESYLQMIQAIDDRNLLSHIVDKETFKQVIQRLPAYVLLMKSTLVAMKKATANG